MLGDFSCFIWIQIISLYIGGSIDNKLNLFKIGMQDGFNFYTLYATNPTGSSTSKKISQIDIIESVLTNDILTCAEKLGSSTFDLAFMYYTELISTGILSLKKVFYLTRS